MNQNATETTKLDFPANLEFTDDTDIALDPAEYRDPAPPLPLMAGNYGVRLTDMGLKRERDDQGNPTETVRLRRSFTDGPTVPPKYPIIEVKKITVANAGEGNDSLVGKSAFPFQEFNTFTQEKKDFNAGGQTYDHNDMSAMIRSNDASLAYRGLNDGLALLKSLVSDGGIFYVRIDWRAEDRKWIREQVAEIDRLEKAGELTSEAARKQRNEVKYKKGIQEGIAKFKTEDGGLSATWIGPSGEEIEARPFIREFISTTQLGKVYKLGPRKI